MGAPPLMGAPPADGRPARLTGSSGDRFAGSGLAFAHHYGESGPSQRRRNGPPQPRDQPHGFDRDPSRHLAAPHRPVVEDDRDLPHPKTSEQRAIGHLDLEYVALRTDAGQVDRLKHLAADALEPAGEIVDVRPEN